MIRSSAFALLCLAASSFAQENAGFVSISPAEPAVPAAPAVPPSGPAALEWWNMVPLRRVVDTSSIFPLPHFLPTGFAHSGPLLSRRPR